MTDKYLKSLIDKLNNNKTNRLIFLRPLSDNIDFAKVWTDQPKPTDGSINSEGPYKFYFIKNSENFYVATVLDMSHDLHWFVLPQHRGKGHLTKALKKIILFHLFQDREEQKITINENAIGRKNYIASEKVAINSGFIKISEDGYKSKYALQRNIYESNTYFNGKNTEIKKERIIELQKKIKYLAKSLWLIQTEIEMKLGYIDYTEELRELVDEIKNQSYRLEDAWHESKNKI